MLIRHQILTACLAIAPLSARAAAPVAPPPALADYVAAVRKADAITDPLARCLAYPDLPGNTWAPGTARARCIMFLTPAPFTLDTLEQALAQPGGGAAVDARFDEMLSAHYAMPDQREQIFIALAIFSGGEHDKAERVARAWLASAPGSPFAHTALAHVLQARGWAARGGRYIQETPAANLEKMTAFFVDAVTHYLAALKTNPKLLPACTGLISIGRQSSDQLETSGIQTCLSADPASYYVIDAMMTAAEPRWGGSVEQMREVAAYAQARVKDNPVLAVFDFHHAYYGIERGDGTDAQALEVLEPATRRVPNAAYMRTVGDAYLREHKDWEGFVQLSQALRFMPSYADQSRYRASLLVRFGEPRWARADAERAVQLAPDSAAAHLLLAKILRDTAGEESARPHYRAAMEDPARREAAYADYCWTWVSDKLHPAEASQCIDDMLREYPENGEAWRQRLLVIGPDAPGSVEAMKRFLATQNPDSPQHQYMAKTVRPMLETRERDASGGSEFARRAARARQLEHTPEGRAYWARFIPASDPAMNEALSLCFRGRRADVTLQFTTVMDVMADGRIAHVQVLPVDAMSVCFARRIAERVKAPPPPAQFADRGFPLVIDTTLKAGK